MRRAGPIPGVLIAADPATVERSGFAIRESRCFRTVRIRGSGKDRPNRKSHWSGITICRGRTPLNLRIVHLFVMPADCGHAIWRKTLREGEANPFVPFGAWRREPGDLPSSRAPSLPGVRPIQGEILPMPARRLSWLYHPVPGTARFALAQMPIRMVHGLRSFPACAEAGIIS